MKWTFVDDPPDQSSSDGEWYALCNGYIKPEAVLADPKQIAKVKKAKKTLQSFFAALDAEEIRTEMWVSRR